MHTQLHDMASHDMTLHDLAWQDTTAHDTTLQFLWFQSMTRHDRQYLTSHPYLWQLRAWEGEGDRGAKKAELCTLMLPEVTNTYSS